MVLNELPPSMMHQAIMNGCYRLIEQRQELNQMNVFPVPDGDTGDNMASVCRAILEASEVKETMSMTLESVALAAMTSSRGNSGILLSHFFIGLYQHLPTATKIHLENWSYALEKIAQEIDAVLSNPCEGTIITVVKNLAQLVRARGNQGELAQVMAEVVPLLKQEVQKTTSYLKLLQEAGVVDAGALGFYYFIEGFSDFLEHGILKESMSFAKIPLFEKNTTCTTEAPTFRYCTEAVLKDPSISQATLLAQLNSLGDCAAIIGTKDLLKIHLHTDNPEHLFAALIPLGTIKYPKVDDMLRQYEMQFAKQHSIALVSDSSADLPTTLQDMHQIHTIPLNIHIGEHDLLDKYSLDSNHFYHELKNLNSYPKTSCANPSKVKQLLERLQTHYEKVLILSIAKNMSGMHDAFLHASKDDQHTYVVDTKTNSAAHGLLLHYAGQLIAEGTSFDVLTQKIEEARACTSLFVLVKQFDSMVRSGRMNKASATLASLVGIKPIVTLDAEGRGVVTAKTSSKKGLQKLIDLVQKKLKQSTSQIADYGIVHANNPDEAMRLAEMATHTFNKPPLFVQTVSLAIGLHAGSGCVAFAMRIAP